VEAQEQEVEPTDERELDNTDETVVGREGRARFGAGVGDSGRGLSDRRADLMSDNVTSLEHDLMSVSSSSRVQPFGTLGLVLSSPNDMGTLYFRERRTRTWPTTSQT
jgi:hypothetical protein